MGLFDGTQWQYNSCTQATTFYNGHQGVFGSSESNVWVVSYGRGVLHWNGVEWDYSTMFYGGPTARYWDGWSDAPNSAWVVGRDEFSQGEIRYYDGNSWSIVYGGAGIPLIYSIWGPNRNDLWAVGLSGHIAHYTDHWEQVIGPTAEHLIDIHGCRSDLIWAVGRDATIIKYDGIDWTIVNAPPEAAGIQLEGVVCLNDTNAVAGGRSGFLLHWNGTNWRVEPSGTTQNIAGIWGASANHVWAGGGGGVLLFWNGHVWTRINSGTSLTHRALWGSSENDIWSVSSIIGGMILNYHP
jgi:hypothetical protein